MKKRKLCCLVPSGNYIYSRRHCFQINTIVMEFLSFLDGKEVHVFMGVNSSIKNITMSMCKTLHLRRSMYGSQQLISGSMFTNLLQLDLSYCHHIKDQHVLSFVGSFKKLQNLSLAACSQITDNSLVLIANGFKETLEELDVSYCSPITDFGVQYITKSLRNLKLLNLLCCRRVTDAGLIHLNKNSTLTQLNLSYTKITDAGLIKNCTKLQSLEFLNICGCCFVGRGGIAAICQALPRLKRVDGRYGPKISRNFFSENCLTIMKSRPEVIACVSELY